MRDPTLSILKAEIATQRAQLQWAAASILDLVQAMELLDRSLHQLEEADPTMTSEQVRLLLQQIRRSHPEPRPAPLPVPAPPLRRAGRHQRRTFVRHPSVG
jgi:hypothetical protein